MLQGLQAARSVQRCSVLRHRTAHQFLPGQPGLGPRLLEQSMETSPRRTRPHSLGCTKGSCRPSPKGQKPMTLHDSTFALKTENLLSVACGMSCALKIQGWLGLPPSKFTFSWKNHRWGQIVELSLHMNWGCSMKGFMCQAEAYGLYAYICNL